MDGFYDVNTKEKFDKTIQILQERGYDWIADSPVLNNRTSFEYCKSRIHGNAKLIIHAFHNSINGKKEIQFGTRSTYKTYPMYKNMKVMEI
jgi:hypothetical protein